MAGTGQTGIGETGSGETGSGETGRSETRSGESGETGSGETRSGETGSSGGTMKKCEICHADFSNRKDFEKHIELVHDDRKGPFTCQMCNDSFSDKTDLEEHISRVHKENTPVEMSKKERKKAEYDACYMAEQKRQDEFYEKFETGCTDEIPDFDPDLMFNLERRKKRNICPHCKGNIGSDIRSHLQNCAEAKVALEKRRQEIIDLGRGSSIGARVDISVASVEKNEKPEDKSIDKTLNENSSNKKIYKIRIAKKRMTPGSKGVKAR